MSRLSLRTTVAGVTVVITVVALLVAGALLRITDLQSGNATTLADAVKSVHLLENAEIDLLAHERAPPGMVRSELEGKIRESLRDAENHVGSNVERALLGEASSRLDTYFADPTSEALDRSFRQMERLVEFNLTESDRALDDAMHWDQVADWIAGALAFVLLLLAGTFLFWLWRTALRPVLEISNTLRDFARGNHAVRAAETGPSELRTIARHVNEMATAIERQRGKQITSVAGVAHDLRNPVSVLRLSLAMADGNESPERSARILQTVRRQIDRLERMLGDLVDAARIESGHLELRTSGLDLRSVARHAYELYASSSNVHRMRIDVPEDAVPVRGDALRLEQVAMNLVNNAVKYSPEGGEVAISVRVKDGEAVFAVTDQGVGIPEEDLPDLFEPFRRVGGLRDQVAGVGLGLSVSRKIVVAHGGTIRVSSRPGHGSVFEFGLPLDRPAHPESAPSLH